MTKPVVEQLDYGGDDENCRFYQALVIRSRGTEHYILHQGYTDYRGDKPIFTHRMARFESRDALLKAETGYAIPEEKWEATDGMCGFSDIPEKEFINADRVGLEKRLYG